MILIDQLSDRTVESWEFIDEFIEQTQYKEIDSIISNALA